MRANIDLHKKYGLTKIINAAGTFTLLGVSRSSSHVANNVRHALENFWLIDELQNAASHKLSDWTGAQAGTIVHCTASAITLSIAAAMTGTDDKKIANLPVVNALPNKVILPATHAINYGQSIQQAICLAGAQPVLAGSSNQCTLGDLQEHMREPGIACLLLVSSRLVTGDEIDLKAAVKTAHEAGLPAIIDGAAQDMRIAELLETGADLLLISAQKYLSAPTAGLIMGTSGLVDAVRANERGIGRAMKASKEAILGVLAAIEERQNMDMPNWQSHQEEKLSWFLEQANEIDAVKATPIPDITSLPLARACLTLTPTKTSMDAVGLVKSLKNGTPSIRVMEYALCEEKIILELVPLQKDEITFILARISEILASE